MQNAGARGDAERRRPRGSGVFLFGSIDPSARDGRSHARPQGELPPARRATNGVSFVPRTAEQAHARRNHGHFEPAASTSADHRRLERAQDAGPCTTIAHGDLPSSPAPRSRAPPPTSRPSAFRHDPSGQQAIAREPRAATRQNTLPPVYATFDGSNPAHRSIAISFDHIYD